MGREIIQNSMIDSLETILSLVANINSHKGVVPQIDIDLLKEHVRKLYQDIHNLDEENQKWKSEPRKVRDEKIMQREENTPMREESEPAIIKQNERPNEIKPEIRNESRQEEQIVQETEVKPETPLIENIVEPVEEKQEDEILQETIDVQKEEPEIIEEMPEEIEEHPVVEKPEAEIPETKEPVAETQITEEPEIKEPIKEEPKEKEPALFDEPLSVADKFSKEEKSINEKLSENNTNNAVHQNAQKTPVSNLKTAIGINDKFMFVNELFQGDMKSYDVFIREINEMNNGDAAIYAYAQKLDSLGAEIESTAALKLGEYIERRFL